MKSLGYCSAGVVAAVFLVYLSATGQEVRPLHTTEEVGMRDAAEATFIATKAAYDAGTIPSVEPLYVWSRRSLDAQLQLADRPSDRKDAYQAHLDRMERLKNEIAAKSGVGARGGEMHNKHATEYYFEEAKVLLDKQGASGN